MTDDRQALRASWKRTTADLVAARAYLENLPGVDLSTASMLLDHNELGLAFEDLVALGNEQDLPLAFWRHLDQAAREMRLYSEGLHTPHLTYIDRCLRRLAAASEPE